MTADLSLARRIRRLRSRAGLTQQQLAAPAYTHAYVSTIEAGKRPPSRAALEHFASKLGVDIDELISGRPRDLPHRLDLDLQDARQLLASGKIEEAENIYVRVADQGRRFRLPRHEGKAKQGRALCAETRGDLETAIGLYEEAESALAELPLTARVDAIAGRARCLQMRGETSTALYILEQALEGLRQRSLLEPGALLRIHTSLVAAYFERGAHGRASESAAEALRLAPQTDDPERLANMHVNVARVLLSEGKIEDAHDSLRRAEELYRELDLRVQVADCHHSRGYLLSRQGDLSAARTELEKAIALFRDIGARVKEARSVIELARVARLEGTIDNAGELVATALELLAGTESIEVAEAERELGLCLAESAPEEAATHLGIAADIFERSSEQTELAATSRLLGDLLESHGDTTGALAAYRRGLIAVEEPL
jgi:tetratricopeptide (TPR) repeat protein